MATVFWDSQEMTLLAFLPKGESVNADRYCETLDRLRHAVPLQNLESCVAELSFYTTMRPTHTHTHAQRSGLSPPATGSSDEMDGPIEPDVLIKSWQTKQVDSSTMFRNLSRTSQFCSEEMNHQLFRICFVQTRSSNDSRTDVCLTLNRQDALDASGTSGSNLGCAQTMMNCVSVLVITVSFCCYFMLSS
ncbi:histone-lysine N-methyltransferase SETMAR [Elysia marginata]|uniref:Histone-lysine N-methyltransferase SETMAR n=1 Tax=Elysia marginata TaxID=1093978 RepID=A0AAV4G8C8_9GAST|nr:histone-lysine N-methyltransferase SETMAR [Elysia marginata]